MGSSPGLFETPTLSAASGHNRQLDARNCPIFTSGGVFQVHRGDSPTEGSSLVRGMIHPSDYLTRPNDTNVTVQSGPHLRICAPGRSHDSRLITPLTTNASLWHPRCSRSVEGHPTRSWPMTVRRTTTAWRPFGIRYGRSGIPSIWARERPGKSVRASRRKVGVPAGVVRCRPPAKRNSGLSTRSMSRRSKERSIQFDLNLSREDPSGRLALNQA
jgi:hypothetical protein